MQFDVCFIAIDTHWEDINLIKQASNLVFTTAYLSYRYNTYFSNQFHFFFPYQTLTTAVEQLSRSSYIVTNQVDKIMIPWIQHFLVVVKLYQVLSFKLYLQIFEHLV